MAGSDITIRLMRAADLDAAERVFRLAFATFVGAPDPDSFMAGRDMLRGRFAMYPDGAHVAYDGDRFIGSCLATRWGSLGWFGPLTVDPAYWSMGIAKRLMEATVGVFERWDIRHAALFTFADSPKHHGLYQKFDFWPRFLTTLTTKEVGRGASLPTGWVRFSGLSTPQRWHFLQQSLALGDSLLSGLDLSLEIRHVADAQVGEAVGYAVDGSLAALAVCHFGPRSEAEPGSCYVKFAMAAPGPRARQSFLSLLAACEGLAAQESLHRLEAGVNLERSAAYRAMLGNGFRAQFCGVSMVRANDPGYNFANAYIIDDLR